MTAFSNRLGKNVTLDNRLGIPGTVFRIHAGRDFLGVHIGGFGVRKARVPNHHVKTAGNFPKVVRQVIRKIATVNHHVEGVDARLAHFVILERAFYGENSPRGSISSGELSKSRLMRCRMVSSRDVSVFFGRKPRTKSASPSGSFERSAF